MSRKYGKKRSCIEAPRKNPWFITYADEQGNRVVLKHPISSYDTLKHADIIKEALKERAGKKHGAMPDLERSMKVEHSIDRPGPGFPTFDVEQHVIEGGRLKPISHVLKSKGFDKANPTMKGKPTLWYPKKGSEAAKDLGSLLQKMRKASDSDKESLKKLFRATRLKWMARDGYSPKPKDKASVKSHAPASQITRKNLGVLGSLGVSLAANAIMSENPPRKYGLFEMGPDGKWVRLAPSLAYKKTDAVRIFQNELLNAALSGGPRRELRPVKSEPDPIGDYLMGTSEENPSSPASRFLSKKIPMLMREGYPQKQAVAIAYSMARKKGYRIGKRKNPYSGPMTERGVQKYLARLGLVMKKDEAGDFRISYKALNGERAEASAMYTPYLDDALGSGEMMAKWWAEQKRKNPALVIIGNPLKCEFCGAAPCICESEQEDDGEYDKTNPFHIITRKKGKIVSHEKFDTKADADAFIDYNALPRGFITSRFTDEEATVGDLIMPGGEVFKYAKKNPGNGAVRVPAKLERDLMKVPAKDRNEVMLGIKKYYEFHGCFPPRIIAENVDHAKVGYPKVNVALGLANKVDYRTVNAKSNKFFAGGKGRYEHKFGDELKNKKNAKPTLVTDPTGTTLHYLPSKFKVKDWIHH